MDAAARYYIIIVSFLPWHEKRENGGWSGRRALPCFGGDVRLLRCSDRKAGCAKCGMISAIAGNGEKEKPRCETCPLNFVSKYQFLLIQQEAERRGARPGERGRPKISPAMTSPLTLGYESLAVRSHFQSSVFVPFINSV